MDIPHNELRGLAKAYVKQATPIVREQERILAQLDGHPDEESLLRRLRQTVDLGFRCDCRSRGTHPNLE